MTTISRNKMPEVIFTKEKGLSLVIVMMILVIVSLLGVSASQIALMGERGARNDRDTQIAFQSAEAGLVDAEFDLLGTSTTSGRSMAAFGQTAGAYFTADCGAAGTKQGLCLAPEVPTQVPAWLAVDFTDTTTASKTVAFGTFTTRSFPSGTNGVQPAKLPRYVIEALPDLNDGAQGRDASAPPTNFVYRVTSMGFGPRDDIQSVTQILFRTP